MTIIRIGLFWVIIENGVQVFKGSHAEVIDLLLEV